jgi:DNA-binding SARP family transcriptional activator
MVAATPVSGSDPVASLVRVRLLGPFAIDLDGKSAGPWPRRSAKRLLALVFLSPKRRISREVASDLLFPDPAPRAVANALYNALSCARAVLSDLGGPATTLLVADHTNIYISPSAPVEVDLDVHEKSLQTALGMEPGADRDTGLTLALLEDGGLLEDEPYSDWPQRRRDGLENARQDARVALARDRSMGYGRSDASAVIEAWEAVFSHDLASEEAASA